MSCWTLWVGGWVGGLDVPPPPPPAPGPGKGMTACASSPPLGSINLIRAWREPPIFTAAEMRIWVGREVDGWVVELIEGIEAVGMRCWSLYGWVGGRRKKRMSC